MKQRPEDTQERKTPISEDIENQRKLTRLVTACYEGLNIYGKTPEQLEAIIMLMQMTLGRFDYEAIRDAFGKYLQNGSVMPTPADIIKIIEPPVEKRKWCATTFIDLRRQQREGQFITKEEKQYIQDFLSAKTKDPDNTMIDDAIKLVEQQDKQYYLAVERG